MSRVVALVDLPTLVGVDLGTSPGAAVSQTDVDAFARTTGDDQWIHVDPARAEREGRAGTIVHGYLLLALLGSFWGEFLTVTGSSSALNYGLDRVRFICQVPTGSVVHASARITEVVERPDGMKVVADFTLTAAAPTAAGQESPAATGQDPTPPAVAARAIVLYLA